ncbi:MAG TPA: hypothetical protein VGW39_01105 [Chthoniobacterales bacterium]|nr:hypothetical protein [Chthoniobacterales bacterium]
MAVPKSLTSRMQELVNSIQELDRPAIKARLSRYARLVKAMEDGTTARKAKAKIARLETALATSDANCEQANAALEQSSAEIANLKSELQTVQAEIAKYQQERAKQKEREREMPDIQFKILSLLPSRHSGKPMSVEEIAPAISSPIDQTEVHINKLKSAGLVVSQLHNFIPTTWRRSNAGNELVYARRLAGDEEAPKPYKYADLPKIQHTALVMMARGSEEGAIFEHQNAYEEEIAKEVGASLRLTQRNLRELRKLEMATDGDEPQQTYGAGTEWWLLDKGEEYLAERGLL